MKKKISFKQLFDNNRFLQIFSLVTAALCWLVVYMTQSYTAPKKIYHVPVNIEQQSSALAEIGLSVVEGGNSYVDVEVEGVRSIVANLTPDDFMLSTKITNVTEGGIYDLKVTSVSSSPNPDYEIKGFSPDTVRVKFDRMDTRQLEIKPRINGLAIAPGYTEKSTSVTPTTVNINGPVSELEKIKSCIVTAELANPSAKPFLDKTFADNFPITLLDANGEALDPEAMHITLDTEEAQIMIQVLKTTELPLEVSFTYVPKGFPIEELEALMHKSQESVTIAGPEDIIKKLTEIQLGYIDLKSLSTENTAYSFDVPLPTPSDQFMRLDNITSVVVSFDDSNWDEAVFNVANIQPLNVPVGYDVEIPAKTIYSVRFVGDIDVLESMISEDIVAEVDLSDREIASGSYSLPVKISVPGKGLVWAVGDHSITVDVTERALEVNE